MFNYIKGEMVGVVIGKWMIGLNWGLSLMGRVYFFVYSVESGDDIFRL